MGRAAAAAGFTVEQVIQLPALIISFAAGQKVGSWAAVSFYAGMLPMSNHMMRIRTLLQSRACLGLVVLLVRTYKPFLTRDH